MLVHHLPKSIFLILLTLCLGCMARSVTTSPGCWSSSISGMTMGTSYHVKVCGEEDPRPANFETFKQTVQMALDGVDQRMSTYKKDSEISRFNRHEKTGWFDVSEETALVVQDALDISRRTDGAFDPTVGPLVQLWNFGPDRRDIDQKPSDEKIDAALKQVGYQKVEVRFNPPSLRKTEPHVELDLSGIAKGYAVDQVAKKLKRIGIKNYMVEIGGEVHVRGLNQDKKPWRIAIEKPDSQGRDIQKVVELTGGSMATSGDYRNFFEKDGVRYSHLIDPTTGRPIRHRLVSVSVRTPTCTEADALATGMIVLGPERAEELARKENLDITLLIREGNRFIEKDVKPKKDAR